jgi:hypothetical protein
MVMLFRDLTNRRQWGLLIEIHHQEVFRTSTANQRHSHFLACGQQDPQLLDCSNISDQSLSG